VNSNGFFKVLEIVFEEQFRNNSFAHGTVAEAKNAVWNAMNSLISSGLCIKTGTSGDGNHNGGKNEGFEMHLFMRGESAQIN
jgi:hypothetical protein